MILGLSVPIASLVAISASPAIHLVYGPAYAQAVPVLIILGIGLVPMSLSIILGMTCIAADRQARWTWLMAGATVVNPALNAVLIPLTEHRFHNGAIGAAIALVATETLVVSGGIFIVGLQVFGISTLKRIARVGVASAGMCIVVLLTRGAGPLVSLSAGGVAFVLLAWLFRAVTPEEWCQLTEWCRRARVRFGAPFARLRRRQGAAHEDETIRSASAAAPMKLAAPAAAHGASDGGSAQDLTPSRR